MQLKKSRHPSSESLRLAVLPLIYNSQISRLRSLATNQTRSLCSRKITRATMRMIWESWLLFLKWKWAMFTMQVWTSSSETWWKPSTSCRSNLRKLRLLSKHSKTISLTWRQTCKLSMTSMSFLRLQKRRLTKMTLLCLSQRSRDQIITWPRRKSYTFRKCSEICSF